MKARTLTPSRLLFLSCLAAGSLIAGDSLY